MDAQTIFNVLVGLIAFLGAWVLNSLRDSIKSLQSSGSELSTKVQAIEVLVAGQYVTRTDMDKNIDKLGTALFTKLDRIELKLDTKADK